MKEAQDFKVYLGKEGDICISQMDYSLLDDIKIIIHPKQVPLLIEWLEDSVKELSNEMV